jgi:hypothetical protein
LKPTFEARASKIETVAKAVLEAHLSSGSKVITPEQVALNEGTLALIRKSRDDKIRFSVH